jgi:hypothetical protein
VLALPALLLLAGCASSQQGEDLNVIIPRTFSQLNGTTAIDAAQNLFNSANPDARRIAIVTLSHKKWGHEPPYMKAYTMLATDPDPLVRGQAMRALGSSHQPAVGPTLAKGLADPDPQVRIDAAAAAGEITSPALIAPLLNVLKNDPDAQARVNAAQALGAYGDRNDVLSGLIHALDDADAAVVHWSELRLKQMTGQDIPPNTRSWLEWLQAQKQG